MVTKNDEGNYTRKYVLNVKQKQILKQYEIDKKYIESKINSINSRMRDNQILFVYKYQTLGLLFLVPDKNYIR